MPSNNNSVENLKDKLETMRRLTKIDQNIERLMKVSSKFVEIDKDKENTNLFKILQNVERTQSDEYEKYIAKNLEVKYSDDDLMKIKERSHFTKNTIKRRISSGESMVLE